MGRSLSRRDGSLLTRNQAEILAHWYISDREANSRGWELRDFIGGAPRRAGGAM